jgi:hypothetical protein
VGDVELKLHLNVPFVETMRVLDTFLVETGFLVGLPTL